MKLHAINRWRRRFSSWLMMAMLFLLFLPATLLAQVDLPNVGPAEPGEAPYGNRALQLVGIILFFISIAAAVIAFFGLLKVARSGGRREGGARDGWIQFGLGTFVAGAAGVGTAFLYPFIRALFG